MNRKNSDWQPRYYKSTIKKLNDKIETQIKGKKARRFQGDPLQLQKPQNMPITVKLTQRTPPSQPAPKGYQFAINSLSLTGSSMDVKSAKG